jgi:hypothetical protein
VTDLDLVLLAEEHRRNLPEGFESTANELSVLLETGAPLHAMTRGSQGSMNQQIKAAVLRELRDLLCTNDKRYEDVRAHGKVITRTSLASVSAYVAGAVGISAGAAMACVAFVALAVAKVGVGAFCRIVKDEPAA